MTSGFDKQMSSNEIIAGDTGIVYGDAGQPLACFCDHDTMMRKIKLLEEQMSDVRARARDLEIERDNMRHIVGEIQVLTWAMNALGRPGTLIPIDARKIPIEELAKAMQVDPAEIRFCDMPLKSYSCFRMPKPTKRKAESQDAPESSQSSQRKRAALKKEAKSPVEEAVVPKGSQAGDDEEVKAKVKTETC